MSEEKSTLRKIIDNEVVRTVAIVTATVAVIGFFYRPLMKLDGRINQLETASDKHDTLTEAINNLKDNHIHSIEIKVDNLEAETKDLKNQIIKIETILEERLPNKK